MRSLAIVQTALRLENQQRGGGGSAMTSAKREPVIALITFCFRLPDIFGNIIGV